MWPASLLTCETGWAALCSASFALRKLTRALQRRSSTAPARRSWRRTRSPNLSERTWGMTVQAARRCQDKVPWDPLGSHRAQELQSRPAAVPTHRLRRWRAVSPRVHHVAELARLPIARSGSARSFRRTSSKSAKTTIGLDSETTSVITRSAPAMRLEDFTSGGVYALAPRARRPPIQPRSRAAHLE